MKRLAFFFALCVYGLFSIRPVCAPAGDSGMLRAQMESESRHVFRGKESPSPPPRARDEARAPQALPRGAPISPRPLQIHLEQDNLTQEQGRMLRDAIGASPLLRQSPLRDIADIRLIARAAEQQSSVSLVRVRLESATGALPAGARDFLLPGDAALLRTVLEGHARWRAAAFAQGGMPWPKLTCAVQAHSPANGGGTITYEGKNWRPSRRLVFSRDGTAEPIRYPALLTFSFSSKSNAGYFVYVLNYNDEGQILPVLPPLGTPDMPNHIAAGKELAPAGLFLELTAPVEHLRIIVSKTPLDLSGLAQDSFASGPRGPGAGGGKAADAGEWSGIAIKLIGK